MKQHPDGSEGGGKRGRPRTGELAQVRIPPEEKSYLKELGDGNLSKGVREVIAIAQATDTTREVAEDLRALAEIKQALTAMGLEEQSPHEQILALRRAARVVARRASATGSVNLKKDAMAVAMKLGQGDPAKGVEMALAAARLLVSSPKS